MGVVSSTGADLNAARTVRDVSRSDSLPASPLSSAPHPDTQATVLAVIDGLSENVSNPLGHLSSATKPLQRQRWTLPGSIAEPSSALCTSLTHTLHDISRAATRLPPQRDTTDRPSTPLNEPYESPRQIIYHYT